MSIARLKLDEATKLEFGVAITGADGKPEARFVIEGKDFSVSFPARQVNEGVEVEIQGLSKIFTAGEYNARLEIVLENKIYTPLIDKIEFEPSVEIQTKSSVVKPVKESVTVAKVTVKKSELNEEQLRKTQAATIIAQSLGYTPAPNATPKQIVDAALESVTSMTAEQIATVKEMLQLAEDIGIDYNKDLEPVEIVAEEKEVPGLEKAKPDDEGYSDDDLEDMASGMKDWDDIIDAYTPGEVHLVDDETGEHVDDLKDELKESELNEVLSRVERIRARVRFHKSAAKRERKLKVALTRHSSATQINHRARTLAIKTLKMKLAKKPLDQLNTAEKERIEGIIAKRKNVINRLAMKMAQRVRQIEKDRLTHKSTQ